MQRASRIAASKSSKRPRPRSLARYIAASASREQRLRRRSPSPRRAAMPTLRADVQRARRRRRTARRAPRASRSPMRAGVAALVDGPRRITTNSSPPKRATVSPARSTLAQPRAASAQQLVAGGVAEESLTTLKRSRSRKSTATALRAAALRARAPGASRSRSSVRFGRPVSGSCSAWWRSSSSARWRSIASPSTFATLCRNALVLGRERARVRAGANEHAEQSSRSRIAPPARATLAIGALLTSPCPRSASPLTCSAASVIGASTRCGRDGSLPTGGVQQESSSPCVSITVNVAASSRRRAASWTARHAAPSCAPPSSPRRSARARSRAPRGGGLATATSITARPRSCGRILVEAAGPTAPPARPTGAATRSAPPPARRERHHRRRCSRTTSRGPARVIAPSSDRSSVLPVKAARQHVVLPTMPSRPVDDRTARREVATSTPPAGTAGRLRRCSASVTR